MSSAKEIFDTCLQEYHRHGDRERASEAIQYALADARSRTLDECLRHFAKLTDESLYESNCRMWFAASTEIQNLKKREHS